MVPARKSRRFTRRKTADDSEKLAKMTDCKEMKTESFSTSERKTKNRSLVEAVTLDCDSLPTCSEYFSSNSENGLPTKQMKLVSKSEAKFTKVNFAEKKTNELVVIEHSAGFNENVEDVVSDYFASVSSFIDTKRTVKRPCMLSDKLTKEDIVTTECVKKISARAKKRDVDVCVSIPERSGSRMKKGTKKMLISTECHDSQEESPHSVSQKIVRSIMCTDSHEGGLHSVTAGQPKMKQGTQSASWPVKAEDVEDSSSESEWEEVEGLQLFMLPALVRIW